MNKRPGHVKVTVETGYCNFCGRTRNLRREEHQLGTLVRTIITCESCHRTLLSSVGVAPVEPEVVEAPAETEAPVLAEAQPTTTVPAKAKAPDKSRVVKPKTAAVKKPAAKPAGRAAASTAKAKTPTKRAPSNKKEK